MTLPPSSALRARWLDALLPQIPFDGWTEQAAKSAAEAAGLDAGEQALAAPNGVADLVEAFFDAAEDKVRAQLADADLGARGPGVA
jgi:ubiquinone biosynthesis protein COQ9